MPRIRQLLRGIAHSVSSGQQSSLPGRSRCEIQPRSEDSGACTRTPRLYRISARHEDEINCDSHSSSSCCGGSLGGSVVDGLRRSVDAGKHAIGRCRISNSSRPRWKTELLVCREPMVRRWPGGWRPMSAISRAVRRRQASIPHYRHLEPGHRRVSFDAADLLSLHNQVHALHGPRTCWPSSCIDRWKGQGYPDEWPNW